jgi:hypothetical protein
MVVFRKVAGNHHQLFAPTEAGARFEGFVGLAHTVDSIEL